jgi:hypothetical protein
LPIIVAEWSIITPLARGFVTKGDQRGRRRGFATGAADVSSIAAAVILSSRDTAKR